MKISAIIPSYNGLKLLKKHLPDVLFALRNNDELIVVDDASSDGSIKWIKKEFKCKSVKKESVNFKIYRETHSKKSKKIEILILKNNKNERYARSVNRGVNVASGSHIFLLNNDVIPSKNVLKHLLSHFKKDSKNDLFAVACHEQNRDGLSGGKNKLWFEKGMFMHSRADNYKTGETAWANGGSSLFSKEKWDELGGLCLDYYPAYWEDTDLSFRARNKGWRIMFEEKAKVEHLHETTNETVFGQEEIAKISWKNSITFLKKHATIWQKIAYIAWKPYWFVLKIKDKLNKQLD